MRTPCYNRYVRVMARIISTLRIRQWKLLSVQRHNIFLLYITVCVKTYQPVNQSTKQSTNRPTNQPSNQSTHQPINQPTNRMTIQPTDQPTIQPVNPPTNQPTKQSINQPNDRPTDWPTNQPKEGHKCIAKVMDTFFMLNAQTLSSKSSLKWIAIDKLKKTAQII